MATEKIEHAVGSNGFFEVTANIKNFFPIDWNGNLHASCDQCLYYRSSTNRCGINFAPCFKPQNYVGSMCPFLEQLEDYFCGTKED